jgi:ribosomal protein S25
MGGKGKKGVAAIEKQQARVTEDSKKDKKRDKKGGEKGQQKAIYLVNEAKGEIQKQIKSGSYYTLYDVASRLNIPLGLARKAVRELEASGSLRQVSKSGNSRLFLAV